MKAGNYFGISTLLWGKMIASGYQILVRQKAKRRALLEDVWHKVFPVGTPRPKTLTEISGQTETGKSSLLYHIMARCVLPREYGGKSCKVIFLDANHKTGIVDFKKCLLDVALDTPHPDTQMRHDVFKNCLESVIYLPCYSAEQFDLALEDIDDLLWDNEDVSLLAIDGLDAFYWEDCYARLLRMSTHYKKLCQRIKPFCQEHNICCIYTVDTNYLQAKRKGVSNLPNPLVDFKLKLVMHKNGERHLNGKRFCIVGSSSVAIKFLE